MFRVRCPNCQRKIRPPRVKRATANVWTGWGYGSPFRCPECDARLRWREPSIVEELMLITPLIVFWPLVAYRRGALVLAGRTVPRATVVPTSPDSESDR